jgi:hypothetical protein
MKLEVGGFYKFKNKDEWFVIEVLHSTKYSYQVTIVNASTYSSRIIDHTFMTPVNGTMLNRDYEVTKVQMIPIKEPDHITYTPELIDLYIEIALINNNKEWFMELTNMKKEVLI